MNLVLLLCLIPLLRHSVLASGEEYATDLDAGESHIMTVETIAEDNDNLKNGAVQPEVSREEPDENESTIRGRRQASFAINLSGIGSYNTVYDDWDNWGHYGGGQMGYPYNWGGSYWGNTAWPTSNWNHGVQIGSLNQNSWPGYPSYGDWGSGYYNPSSSWGNSGWNNANIGGNQNLNWNNGGWQGGVNQDNWGNQYWRRF